MGMSRYPNQSADEARKAGILADGPRCPPHVPPVAQQ